MRNRRLSFLFTIAGVLLAAALAAFWGFVPDPVDGSFGQSNSVVSIAIVAGTFSVGVAAGVLAFAVFRNRASSTGAEAAAHYKRLVEGIDGLNDGVAFFDEDLRLAHFNRRYIEIYEPASRNWRIGTLLEQIARETARDCIGYEKQEEIDAFVAKRLAAHKETRPVEQLLKNGTWVRVNEHSLSNGWTVGTRTDVTSLKMRETDIERAKAEVQESEKRFRTIAETVPVAIGISRFDDGTILYVNKRWRRLHAVSDEEDVIGRKAGSLYKAPGDRSTFIAMLEKMGEVQNHEIEFIRLDGETIAISMSARVIIYEGRRAILMALQDITERRKAERELKSATLQAEAANTAKSSFIATMSHELRTPLNAIIGMSDVIMESATTEVQRQDVGIIREAGNALLSIINDILDISKIESGKLELEAISFELNDVLASVLNLLRPNAEEKGLTLHSSVEDDVPTFLFGDYGRLRQIVLNITANAVKFTDQGTVCLSVRSTALQGDDVELRFDVTDTGIGIPQSVQRTLFDPFMQADASTTRRFGGTGLGLAICKELCALMRGDIGVESELGEGSRFWFTVRMKQAGKRAQGDRRQESQDRRGEDQAEARRLRILLAEDSEINQKVIRAILAKTGHTIDIVENGVDAVNAIQETTFDLVLMDVQMPEMDGIAATRAIRAFGGDRSMIPIIALTANAMKGDREACIEAGMNEYVSKPIDPEQLARAISNVCGIRTTLEGPPRRSTEDKPTLSRIELEEKAAELLGKVDSAAGKSS